MFTAGHIVKSKLNGEKLLILKKVNNENFICKYVIETYDNQTNFFQFFWDKHRQEEVILTKDNLKLFEIDSTVDHMERLRFTYELS